MRDKALRFEDDLGRMIYIGPDAVVSSLHPSGIQGYTVINLGPVMYCVRGEPDDVAKLIWPVSEYVRAADRMQRIREQERALQSARATEKEDSNA